LVVRESDKPTLSVPGGGYEIEDKSVKIAGARELFQETGYFVNFNNLFFVDAFFKPDEKNPGGVHCKLFLGCFKEDVVAVRNLSFPNGSIVEVIDLPIVIKDDEIVFVGGKMINIHRMALESFVEVVDVY
jgi:8-oxo-dGTP pyrophosphatase MutT (NUDIX family)